MRGPRERECRRASTWRRAIASNSSSAWPAPTATHVSGESAIRVGIAGLAPGDALVVAGKGHEVGQIVGGTTLPFSDHEAVAKALAGEGA